MWKKIKEHKYLLIKYYFLGIILAVIVFQFFTKSIRKNELDFNSILEKETLKYIIATLIGGFVGGLIFILMTANKIDKQIEILWRNHKKKYTIFY